MFVILYVISALVLSILLMVLPIIFMPLIRIFKTKNENISTTDLRFLTPYILSTILLLYLTQLIWYSWGYETGWHFPVFIALIHLVLGAAKGANSTNQAQSYAVVYGVIIYGIINALS